MPGSGDRDDLDVAAGDARLARTSCAMLFAASSLSEVVYLAVFFAAGPYIGRVFTDDSEVLRIVEDACATCAFGSTVTSSVCFVTKLLES